MVVNSRMPAVASSRPWPLRLVPPNGRRGSEATTALTNTAPEVMERARRTARSTSAVQMLSPRPYSLALASSASSASVPAEAIAATGPKVSSSIAAMPGRASPSTVGW